MEAIWKAAQGERGISIMKLSIIVPVYNLENYVAKTLDSLLSIRFSHDYEIIVVNDGSTDGSEAVIRAYQEKTDKVRLFTTENHGLPGARNYGVGKAIGDYITFFDGDDTVEPDFYEKAVAELDRGGYDFVQGNYREVYADHVVPVEFVKQDMEITDRRQMMGLYVDRGNKRISNNACGKVYRGEIARQVPFNPELKNSEDREYNFDVLCIADRVKLLRDMSFDYLQRSDSIVHTLNARKALSKLDVTEHMLEKNPYPELVLPIEEEHIRTLQEAFYYLCREKDPRAKEIHRKILELPIRELWPDLSASARKWISLHRFAGPLYGWYLTHRK